MQNNEVIWQTQVPFIFELNQKLLTDTIKSKAFDRALDSAKHFLRTTKWQLTFPGSLKPSIKLPERQWLSPPTTHQTVFIFYSNFIKTKKIVLNFCNHLKVLKSLTLKQSNIQK